METSYGFKYLAKTIHPIMWM